MALHFTNLLRGLRSNLKFNNRFQLIYDRLFRRDLELTHYLWGNRFVFVCNSKLRDHIGLQECFCDRVYDKVLDQCNFVSNRIAYVNIGANIGAFDVLLQERGLVIEAGLAVELNPHTCARCLVNLHANGLFRTRVVNAGIAGNCGRILFRPTTMSIADTIFTAQGTTKDGIEVELLTLQALLEKHAGQVQQFDVLKLDCEQAEYAIIRSTPIELLRRFRYIIVEFHPEPGNESFESACLKLKEAGFRPFRNCRKSEGVELFTRC